MTSFRSSGAVNGHGLDGTGVWVQAYYAAHCYFKKSVRRGPKNIFYSCQSHGLSHIHLVSQSLVRSVLYIYYMMNNTCHLT
jgi:hypothetical protein